MIRTGFLAFLLLCLTWPVANAQNDGDFNLSKAVNEAGRQRMLTQRILKTYSQIGLGIRPELSRKELENSVALFEMQLERLNSIASDPELQKALDTIQNLWQPYKRLATDEVTLENARQLQRSSEDLLYESHKLVLQLLDRSETESGELINIAGRQRMLSQRLAKYYLLNSWGVNSISIRSQVIDARNEFAGGLQLLQSRSIYNPEISEQLHLLAWNWEWLDSALKEQGDSRSDLEVLDASELLLNILEVLTGLYELEAIYPSN
jgi:nitrate/nitrite-specific signal transduction histidine kinase